ncbi:MAG: hypothetical protein A2161_17735 [Candidatus Schekmanbacteria bacterium RBG_13_48_7]|uniref:Protein CyaE n=1 Tax=Candidatus Schekmanbacteria bacterium RBG_13_48_7 TaxID=1817878 RepID=A0A1F7RRA4_9BACT|nr:MAG: hypothetical protein A2161_17735 [Candidatus Schekmanbacteria bacterium RBG_13_48_7]
MRLFKAEKILLIITLIFSANQHCAASETGGQKPVARNNITDLIELQEELTLEECINIALENNPDITQGKWNIEVAKAEADISAGQLWPTIQAALGYNYYLDNQRLVSPKIPAESSTFTNDIISGDIVLRLPLYTGGRLQNLFKSKNYLTESSGNMLMHTRREVVFKVSHVFYSILGHEKVKDSLVFSQQVLEEHHKRVCELMEVEKAARVDILRTEVRLADIEQRLLRENNILDLQKALLENLLGVNTLSRPLDVKGELTLYDLSIDLNQSISEAFNQRRDFQALQSRVEAQKKNVDIFEAGYRPIVSLEATYGARWTAGQTIGGSDTSEDVGRVGVVAEIPLFEGGQIRARIRRERSKLWVEKESLRNLQLRIKLEVKIAVSNIESTKARVRATEKAVEQAKESLRIEREKYDLGKGTIIDVLDAQSAMLESQTNYYSSLVDYNVAVAGWYLAVGREK